MKKNVLLSIIVPIYNVEKYIGSLVNSLVKQTNKNFEVIFIDDGSTDESMQILKEIMAGSEQEFSLKLLQQVNQGLSSARNIGILNATGEYIFFLDSDDEIETNFVETILTSCYKYSQPDTFIFDYSSIDEFGNALDSNYGHGSIYRQKDLCTSEQILTALSKDEIPTTAWSFVTKRSVIEKHDLLFSVGKKFEDTNFTPKVFYFSKNIVVISLRLYRYRQRSGSIMSKHPEKFFSDAIFVTYDLLDFYDQYKIRELGAVVGRSVMTTLSSFPDSKKLYNELNPIRKKVFKDHISIEKRHIKRIKMYVFSSYVGYKLYSLVKGKHWKGI
ncbi:glycosyltransferase [Leuconostoc mesenteroides]|uniref:glycosyltransferase n=1 Tax=Leuconostoc mesenteroides TaxID=1245 RepID=UPI00236022C4|nr:glycosyltransferase family 2 protein [Leuconostoc mesenteroides]